ncbi:MAG: MerR family transcriptional regulator [Hyphomonas sp.]|uniref:MerR family transcriptional regulator n=1 Tax=Hyphomonas sp. TaxID=87 RepID=UPI0017A2D6EA|nr:MerR family transcriptional regulator [Hyphomonas sp.]MBU3919479.1 MerR family transcriptional regulator [Alphaproteobacteria bacterium]MBA3069998.1 MerR family transcriptional regulator [Hyphomonas sp.]MBU4060426.1 MerR family transcriptional regulator [Alphaproteobacteria bacterium]MBU4163094.1 MerR family transcriptional regulator [Alphaproteobacteria bacterium]MBU4568419.1 MerR family transcriptional regulator [Alphaproteobacteria bacterium]
MTALRSRIEKSSSALRSIGEAANELGLETHVLRYWETRFPKDVRPIKRDDGRRMFRPQDMDALRAIRVLVHDRGMTLKGAKAILAEQGIEAVLAGTATLTAAAPEPVPSPARELQASVARAFGAQEDAADRKVRLEGALQELTGIKSRIDAARARRAA